MIYLVAGYMFLFIFRPFEYWPFLGDLRIERVYILFLMVAVFFWRDKRYLPHQVNRLVLLFLLVMGLSSLTALSFEAAHTATFEYFKILVFYFILLFTLKDEEDLKKFVLAYLAIMTIYVGKSAWEFFIHDRYVWRMGIRRMIAVDTSYGDPNSFAASIAYSLPLLWAMIRFFRGENAWIYRFLWGYAALALMAVVFTGSRSGMVTCLLFFLLAWWESARKFAGLIVLGATLTLGWHYTPEDLKLRFLSVFYKGIAPAAAAADSSAEGRLEGLYQGLRVFAEHPVLGVGPGNFRLTWDIGMSAHNLYGQLLGEMGLLGTGVFFWLIWAIYRTHRRNRTTIRELEAAGSVPEESRGNLRLIRLLSFASVQTLILLLFNGNFGHNLYRYNWLWIGAIGIVAAHALRRYQRPAPVPDRRGTAAIVRIKAPGGAAQ